MTTNVIPISENVHFLSPIESAKLVPKKLKKNPKNKTKCNICGKSFQQHNRFERFCMVCKEESELYHYSEGY